MKVTGFKPALVSQNTVYSSYFVLSNLGCAAGCTAGCVNSGAGKCDCKCFIASGVAVRATPKIRINLITNNDVHNVWAIQGAQCHGGDVISRALLHWSTL